MTLAMGNSSAATGLRAIAIGSPNTSGSANQDMTQNTQSSGVDAIALGTAARSTGDSATAIGQTSSASKVNAVAIGTGATSSNSNATAVGNSASASGSSAAAYGDIATASGANSTGIGKSAAAQSDNSTAVGNSARASNASATAIGDSTSASGTNSFSGGKSAVANAGNATALGNAAQATNTSATALGDSSAASGLNSISVGKSAAASTDNTIALGTSSKASGTYSSAIGANSSAGATYANALGASSNASGAYSFAEGKDSKASGYSSTAIGNVATATDQQAVAVGLSATASGRRSIAIGAPSEQSPASTSTNDSDRITKDATLGTKASAPDAMAIGSGAQATAQYATALGTNTAASNKNTIALGKNAAASGLSAVSIGYDAKGIGNYTVTIGEDSSAKGDFGAAIGNYAAATGTQSFAGGYKAAASQANAAAVGSNAIASGASSTALGTSAAASGESSLAAGSSANASGVNSTSVGAGSQASGESATSLGRNARSEGSHALAAGYNAAASDVSAIALGDSSAASKQNALAVGQGAQATETGAMALGQGANAAEADTVAIGNTSTASGESAIALGKGTKSSVTSGVALGEGANANRAGLGGSNEAFSGTSVASTKGAVSVGSTDNERQIVNVAGGTQDTDAVNVRQLKYVGNAVVTSLGGGAAFDASSGTYTAPTYTNNNKSFNNVADALSDVNSGAVKYERGSDGSINKDKATLEGGSNGTTLDNVANGTVSSSSKQAINGSQLYGTSSSVANALGGGSTVNPDGTVSNPSYTVHNADGTTTNAGNVGDAITNVDNRTAGNTDAINNINSGKTGLTQQAAAGEKITVGKDTDGTEVSFADKNNGTRKLTNVTAGTLASNSTDAVNGGQLYTEQAQRRTADNGLATALGGGAAVADDGTVTAPTYTNNNKSFNNVAEALSDVNSGAVKYERGSDGSINKDKATLEGGSNGTTLDNVANGTVSSSSKQAINGSQLYGTSSSVANALGGGSTVNPDGTVSNPSYTVHNADGSTATANNVGDAITNVDNRTAGNTTAINDINSGKTGLTQQAAAGDKITVGKDTDGTEVSFADKNSGTRKLTNVTAGAVASNSTDAVNGGQLYTEQAQRRTADNGLATALGGGAAVADDGTVTVPTYTNNNKSFNNVAEALSDVNSGAVKYERGSDGSINKDKATLEGGSNGTTLDNVANGTVSSSSKQAINGSQLYGTSSSVANALGGGSTVNPDGTVSHPSYTVHNADGTTTNAGNVGDAITNVDNRTAGNTTAINDINSGKTGLTQQAAAGEKITVGKDTDGTEVSFADKNSGTRKLTNVTAGTLASNSTDAVIGGQLYTEQAQRRTADNGLATALGGGAAVADDGTVTAPTYTNNNKSFNNVAEALSDVNSGAVKYERGSDGSINKDKATLEGGSNGTTLDNVANGTVSSSSKQAINGSQLYGTSSSVANALGGGSTVNPDGTVSNPSYTVHNADGSTATANNVGDAITNVDNRTAGNTTAINDINSGKTGLTQQAAAGEKITVGKDTDGTEVSFADKNSGTRKLTNVTAGTLASNSTDAVNGGQLYTEQAQRRTADNGLATALGGGAAVADDGSVTAPTYTNNNKSFNNVAEALSDVNSGAVKYERGSDGSINKDKATLEGGSNGTTLDNVANGTVSSSSKQAINGSQLYGTSSSVANALGGGSTVNPDGTVSNPSYTVHNADGSTTTANNVGDAITNVDNRTAGNTTAINDINSGKTGLTQQAAAGEKITVGKDTDGTEVSFADKNSGTRKLTNVTAGTLAPNSTDAVNGGQLYTEQAQRRTADNGLATALGGGAAVADDGTVTAPTYTNNNKSFNNVAEALSDVNSGAVKYERGSDGSINKDKATLEGGSNGTTLDNVANGTVSSSSKQAINGSQLYGTSSSVANALGGGSTVNPDGTVSNPSYTVHNADGSTATANNVGDAITNVDNRTAGNTTAINDINSGKTGLTQQAAAGEKITVGKDTDGTEVSFADKNNAARKLTNVAAGTIASESTDAINGSQLYASNESLANALGGGSTLNPDGTVTKPTYANNGTTYNNIGDALKDVNDGAVKYNRNSDGTIDKSKASLEGGDAGTTLDNVAPGSVAADSKQAVNGSQLHSEQTQRQTADTGLANALGGGSKVADDGTVTNPTYTVHNADGSTTTANNVGDALTNVDTRTAGNTDAINNINSGKTGLTQQAAAGEKITVGKDTDGTEVSFADKNNVARKLANVAAGTIASESTDAINGSQLYASNESLANALGGGSTLNPDGTVTKPTYANNGTTYNNIGDALKDVNDGAVKYNRNSDGTIDKSKASLEGGDAGTTLDNVAPGSVAADSKQAVNGSQLHSEQTQRQTADTGLANALGGGSKVADDGTVTNPTYTVHNADGSTTTANNVGDALTNVDTRTAGNTDAINNINSGKTGLVQQASAGKPITVAKDTDGTEVTFADKDGKTRTLTNVSAGKVSSNSVDAINGSQLYAGNQSIANALGGGSTVNPDGTVSNPSYTVHNADGSTTTANNVGDAITNVDSRTAGNTDAINNINRGKTGLTQQAAAGEKITVGKDTDGTEVSFADKDKNARKLTNVAAGTIASESKDAINGSQLYASNESLANALGGGSTLNPDGTVTKPTYANNGTTYNNIGDALKDVNDGAVKYNRNSDGTIDKSKASLEGGDAGTTLDNVAPGSVAADSKQAVNGSQLHSEQTQRQTADTGLANALGGGSKVADDGTVTNPTYTVHNADGSTSTANNVGDALTNVDTRTAGNTDAINNINSGKTGLVQQESAGKSITVAKDTDGTEVTFADKDGKTRTLTNVSAGKVSSDSVDAINGSQLYAGNQSIANALGGGSTLNPDGTVTAPSYQLHTYNQHSGEQPAVTYSNVGEALSNVDGRTITNTDQIREIAARVNPAGEYGYSVNGRNFDRVEEAMRDIDAGAVKYDRNTDGTINTSKASLEGGDKGTVLDNVANGAVTADSKQAVNGSQLYATNQAISDITGGKTGLTQQAAAGEKITVGKDTDGTEVSFADKNGGTRTLTSVSDGSVSATSKEAVNGSQLHSEQTQRQTADTGLANALGGGASVADNGSVTAPSYTLHNADGSTTTANNVGGALTNLDDRTVNNTNAINQMASGKSGLVQQESNDATITVGKDSNGKTVTFADKDGNARKLMQVANGDINSTSQDAINGSQLHASNMSIANSLGGGSTVNADGTLSVPVYTLNGKQYVGVDQALQGLGQSTASNSDSGSSSATGDHSSATGAGSNASGTGATANGDKASAIGNGSTAGGANSVASNTNSTALGNGAKATGENASATGAGASAGGKESTATGANSSAKGDYATASGVNAQASGTGSTASGHGAKATSDNSSAFGRDAVASGTGSTAGGNAAKASGDGSTAYGQNATASGSQSAAFGQNATADGQNSVALGAGSSTDGRDNTVSVGSAGSERAISNVADGTQAHDAATVGQMSRGFSAMDHRIDKVERHAKAGTASAMAMTGLPQAVLPGRSMMSAAGGTFEGQSAVAVGLSTMTDNGRWIIKGQVSGNTQGEVGGAVGVGYQW
ncbi:YadA-like family protein [Zymobacter sp. IVIA_12111.31 C1]|uniref:YadA-like family protein n=1 Tax=Zymobacter sp. IVIA_12111.31 C1 TaxID=3394854 RepID=UPI0039C03A40